MSQADRIADLEAEVQYLRSELGLVQSAERIASLTAMKLSIAEARMLLALYETNRMMSSQALFDFVDHPADGSDERCVRVYVSRIRKRISYEAIETVRALGYRITPLGRRIVCGALNSVPSSNRNTLAPA